MPRLRKHKNTADMRGITLTEAVVSVLILGIAIGAMVGVFMISKVSIIKAKHYIGVTNLLQYEMEELKDAVYDNVASAASQDITIDIGPDLTAGTSDDLTGQITVEVRDKEDLDGDTDTLETTIDVDGDGENDACKPVYVTISWTSPGWGGGSSVSEGLATLISE